MQALSIFDKHHSFLLLGTFLLITMLSIGGSSQVENALQYRAYAATNDAFSDPDTSMITISENNLSVSFSYGFHKASKYGRKMNVIAYVTNHGKDFRGTIGILSVPTRNSEETLYEIPCTIASGETKKFELTATVAYSNWPSLLIKDEQEHTILQKNFHVIMTTQSTIAFTAVLTDEPEDIDYISSTGLAKLFFLDEETLPSTAAGLDSLDILMISNFNTSRLSENQINAILEWTENGGMLVFGTGGTATKTLSAFQKNIFNGTIGDVEKRTTLLGMNKQEFLAIKEELYTSINQSLDYEEEQDSSEGEKAEITEDINAKVTLEIEEQKPGRFSKTDIDSLSLKEMPKDMISMNFENFVPVLSESDDFPLLLKNNYGKGVILAAAFELGIAGKYRASMGTQLYHIITDNFSETGKKRMDDSNFDRSYSLSRALGINTLSSYPHLKLYFFILLAYAILAGPILYFILKKLDKRHLLWVLTPAFCVACTMIIYILGSSTRVTEPYINYLSFSKVEPLDENNTVSQEVYFNIAAPYNKKYSITLSDTSNLEIRGDSDYGMSFSYDTDEPKKSSYYKTAIYKDNSNETTLIMNDYASFQAACFRCNYKKEQNLSETFNTNLKLKKDFTLTGTITNNLGMDLYQAAYLCNGQLYILGAMEHGSTVSLKDCPSGPFFSYSDLENSRPSGESLLEMLAGGSGWYSGSDPLVRQIYFAYEYYLTSDSSLYTSDGQIIAIAQSAPMDFLTDTGLSVHGLQILDIPISPVKFNSMHVEPLDQSFASVIEGEQDYPNYRHIYNTQTISYQIKEPETVTSLVYKEINGDDFEENSSFHGTIMAYNLITGNYDILFADGIPGSFDDLSSYLTANGELILRFNVNSNTINNDASEMVPILYLLREGK